MNGIDFNNFKGSNLGDPKFGQDAVNLRTAQKLLSTINNLTGLTCGNIVTTGLTASTIITSNLTATTLNVTLLQFEPITGFSPAPNTGLMFFDGTINKLCIYTGNSIFDLVILS